MGLYRGTLVYVYIYIHIYIPFFVEERARTRALAVDAYGPAVAALKRTAEANGLADAWLLGS